MCKVEKTSSQARKIQTCCFCFRCAKPPGSLWSHQTGRVQAAVWPTSTDHVQTIFIRAVTLIFWYICWYNTFVILVLRTFCYFLHSLCKRQQRLLYNVQVLELGSVGPVESTVIWSSAEDLLTWRGRFFTSLLSDFTLLSAVGSVRSAAPFCLHHHHQPCLNSIRRVPVQHTSSWCIKKRNKR